MKIKTSELTGPALDWAVAKCDGFTPHQTCMYDTPTLWRNGRRYSPSTDWSEGGQIIEGEEIGVVRNAPCSRGREWEARPSITAKGAGGQWSYGPTPLIAAMRCYCSAKLGDEIDVPEELCQQQSS